MSIKGGGSVGVFLKASRSANLPDLGRVSVTESVAPTRTSPARDVAGEILELLNEKPLPAQEISQRAGLTTTEAMRVLDRLEHFGLVEVATEGQQTVIKRSGS